MGTMNIDREDSAKLLATLAALWGPNAFDATSIAAVCFDQQYLEEPVNELMPVLAFLDVRRKKSSWLPGWLTQASLTRVRNWFDAIEDRDIDGFKLVRDDLGWCRIRSIGE